MYPHENEPTAPFRKNEVTAKTDLMDSNEKQIKKEVKETKEIITKKEPKKNEINLKQYLSNARLPREHHPKLIDAFETWLRFNKNNSHVKRLTSEAWDKLYEEYVRS